MNKKLFFFFYTYSILFRFLNTMDVRNLHKSVKKTNVRVITVNEVVIFRA